MTGDMCWRGENHQRQLSDHVDGSWTDFGSANHPMFQSKGKEPAQ